MRCDTLGILSIDESLSFVLELFSLHSISSLLAHGFRRLWSICLSLFQHFVH